MHTCMHLNTQLYAMFMCVRMCFHVWAAYVITRNAVMWAFVCAAAVAFAIVVVVGVVIAAAAAADDKVMQLHATEIPLTSSR